MQVKFSPKYIPLIRIILNLLFAVVSTTHVIAAEIKLIKHPDPKNVPVIMIRGEIVRGDAAEFQRQVIGINRGLVVLSSPGGLIDEAFQIGAEVNIQGLATMVVDECASACGLVWLSGNDVTLTRVRKLGSMLPT